MAYQFAYDNLYLSDGCSPFCKYNITEEDDNHIVPILNLPYYEVGWLLLNIKCIKLVVVNNLESFLCFKLIKVD